MNNPFEHGNNRPTLLWSYNFRETDLLQRVRQYKRQKKDRKARTIVYTAIIGGYDQLILPETIIEDWDYVVFSDSYITGEHIFETRAPVYYHRDPTRTARYHKINSHVLFPDHEHVIWIDANILVRGQHLKKTMDAFYASDDLIMCNPHPLRSCIYEELETCLELGKDDPETMKTQIEKYKEKGFPAMQGLFETNILIRKHKKGQVIKLNQDWWHEINAGSRRDQLSFPYVLFKNNIKCENLPGMKDIRTHEGNDYCLFQHPGQKKPNAKVPPYVVPSFLKANPNCKTSYQGELNGFDPNSLKQYENERIDIIVCVHNALDDVKRSLGAVLKSLLIKHRLIIIDDGSDEDTKQYLKSIEQEFRSVTLLRHEIAKGYTKSANSGLKISDSEFKILLNSDTIVTRNWSLKLLQAAHSSKNVGIVGPMSNAASWQSLPVVLDPNKKGKVFVINDIPEGKTISELDQLCEKFGWYDRFPRVPLVNGFCYGIKKKVIDAIGFFDEDAFPYGFGEEDDYSLRAIDAGFKCVIATHSYVYHAKSKSFGKSTRRELAAQGGNYIREKYGSDRISRLMEIMQNHPKLDYIRKSITEEWGNEFNAHHRESISNRVDSDSTFEIARLNDEVRKKNQELFEYKTKELYQLISWMSGLEKALEALLVSRGFKFGQSVSRLVQMVFLRKKSPTAVDEINETLNRGKELKSFLQQKVIKANSAISNNGQLLIDWMNMLRNDFQAFIQSKRWRIGHGFFRLIEKMLLRPKVLLATDDMVSIFEKFENWKEMQLSVNSGSPPNFTNIELLEKWLETLDRNFQATLKSHRWRFGTTIVEIIGWFLHRNQETIVTEHMQKIFNDYRQQYIPNKSVDPNKLQTIDKPSMPVTLTNNSCNNLHDSLSQISKVQERAMNGAVRPDHIGRIKYLFQNLGFTQRGQNDLQKIAADDSEPILQKQAAWILANWHSNEYNVNSAQLCLELLSIISQDEKDPSLLQRIALIHGECYSILGNQDEAKKRINATISDYPSPDLYLAAANLASSLESRIDYINKALDFYRLSNVKLSESKEKHPYDRLSPKSLNSQVSEDIITKYKVSIIIPAFNSENSISTALDSILSQTWHNLEVIVVDDCSTDDTVSQILRYKKLDPRLKLIRSDANNGPYIARNLALKSATGDFVTCNDADDWSHPQKIELQALQLINNPECMANMSKWARLTNDLIAYRRGNPGFYIQSNISSLMFRRKPVMRKLGFWDSVRFGADTELFIRIQKVFGKTAIEEENLGLLSFGRSTAHSLTENSTTGYPGFPMGARQEYRESYLFYHDLSRKFRYPFPQKKRPFPIPDLMRSDESLKNEREFMPKVVFAFDFRLSGDLLPIITEIQALKNQGITIGLVNMAVYDLRIDRKSIQTKIRELIDGDQIRRIVYGEKVHCDTLIIRSPRILQDKQKYIPNIQAEKICVIIDRLPHQSSEHAGMLYDIDRCERHLRDYFCGDNIWYPETVIIRRELNQHYRGSLKSIVLSDHNWSMSIITRKDTQDHPEKSDRKDTNHALLTEDNPIKFIDVRNIDSLAHFNFNHIAVVMPCIDAAKAKITAEILAKRAGIACNILIMHDSLRQGFIKTLNDTARRVKAKYIVYLAEDAFPGRQWLRSAYESLEQSGKGLLGFNDGKWKGRIASFGMVHIDWVQALYHGPVFCPEYKSHKADNELTVIARALDMYVYNPDCVLVEHDHEKDLVGGSNPIDDEIFGNRFVRGFDGILQFQNIRHLASEYKVKIDDYL